MKSAHVRSKRMRVEEERNRRACARDEVGVMTTLKRIFTPSSGGHLYEGRKRGCHNVTLDTLEKALTAKERRWRERERPNERLKEKTAMNRHSGFLFRDCADNEKSN